MAFEKFDGMGRRTRGGLSSSIPQVTLHPKVAGGAFQFNRGASREFGTAGRGSIYFDPGERRIGFRVGPDEDYALTANNNSDSPAYRTSAAAFINETGIRPEQVDHNILTYDPALDLWVTTLRELPREE